MTNEERQKFLEGKPTYSCRFHPTNWWHEVGCPHKDWSKEDKTIKAWAVTRNKTIFYCREEVNGNDIFPFAIFDDRSEAERKLSELTNGYKVVPCEIKIKS